MTTVDLAGLASRIGLTAGQLASAIGIFVVVILILFRRPIRHAAKFVVNAIFALVFIGLIINGTVMLYNLFGPLQAGGFVVAVALFIFFVGRKDYGSNEEQSIGYDYDDSQEQDDLERRNREFQLRESERIRRNIENIRRR